MSHTGHSPQFPSGSPLSFAPFSHIFLLPIQFRSCLPLLNEIQLKALMMIRTKKRRLLRRYQPVDLLPSLPAPAPAPQLLLLCGYQIRMPDVGLRLFIVNTRQLLKDKFICTHAYDAGTDLGSDWDWHRDWHWVWHWAHGPT